MSLIPHPNSHRWKSLKYFSYFRSLHLLFHMHRFNQPPDNVVTYVCIEKKISLHLDPHSSSLCCSRVNYISSYIVLIRMQSSGTEIIVEQSRENILSYLFMNSKWPRNSWQFLTQWLWGINEGFLYKITLHYSYLYGFYLLSLERFLLMQFVSRVIFFL